MIRIDDVRKYPVMVPMISVPQNEDQKYNLIFMSENSNFMNSYRYLNIRQFYVRRITAVPFKVPRLIATMGTLAPYKDLGLLPILDVKENNVFIDTSPFFSLISNTYGPNSYKQPIVFTKVINYFNECKNIGENRKNILIYHIDLNRPIEKNILLLKAFVLVKIARVGEGSFPFDNVILAIQEGGSIKYSSIFSKSIQFSSGKIISIFKNLIGQQEVEEPEEEPTNDINPEEERPKGYDIVNDIV
jgi:hypothetical protein